MFILQKKFSKIISCDNGKYKNASDPNFGKILNNNLAWFRGGNVCYKKGWGFWAITKLDLVTTG